jgi:N-acetylneuraminic acid mutarotase
MKRYTILIMMCFFVSALYAQTWKPAEPLNLPTARHENGMAAANGKLYLIGGRGDRPVEEYDPKKDVWSVRTQAPMEMHHFQAVAYNNEIYVLGAFSGKFPHETPIPNLYIYSPSKNEWRKGPELPSNRLRGAAGAFTYKDKIYLVCGIQDGHYDGHVAWFDVFDPKTNKWEVFADAPRPRDHLQVDVVKDKLYVVGGRRSSAKTNEPMSLTVKEVDVYDFKKGTWETLPEQNNLPTQRAGHTVMAFGGRILVAGGESAAQVPAHREVEAYNPARDRWETVMPLTQGRHGTQAVLLNGKVYVVAGSGNRGGGPELTSMEVLEK